MYDDPEFVTPNTYKIEVRDLATLKTVLSPYMEAIKKGWSLSVSALFTAIWACEQLSQPAVIEFGSGLSTKILSSYFKNALDILSIEHDAAFAHSVREELKEFPRTKIRTCPLIQFSDLEFEFFFNGTFHPSQMAATGKPVDAGKNNNHLMRNTFYNLSGVEIPSPPGGSLFILDGPHGNGRSLAFPFVAQAAMARTFVLIDDVNDYDFLWRAGRCFRYDLVYGEMHGHKRWVLLELRKTS